jgi:2-succinyl-5-enolpyruvyl-6-hydroxy-3-cyclohexene-1-carboxylate synthase
LDQKWSQSLSQLLSSEPTSEPGILAALSRQIPNGSRVYLGNSLPIREWDLAAVSQCKKFEVWGSRGLNGIDGQLSTFLGFARSENSNWAVLGDLTALYDLPGPWILSQLQSLNMNLVIINNGGGKIFSKMFPYSEFQNQHQLRFRSWAEFWKLDYETFSEIPCSESWAAEYRKRVIELIPDSEATARFWKEYQRL